jgi:hypothetical protein
MKRHMVYELTELPKCSIVMPVRLLQLMPGFWLISDDIGCINITKKKTTTTKTSFLQKCRIRFFVLMCACEPRPPMIFKTIAALSNETVSVVKQSGSVSGGAEMMHQCSSNEKACAK